MKRLLMACLLALAVTACGSGPTEPEGCEPSVYEPTQGYAIPEFCPPSDTTST